MDLGGRGGGLGEIVISRAYFEAHCAGDFEHPRNMVVGVINADEIKPLYLAPIVLSVAEAFGRARELPPAVRRYSTPVRG